MPRLVHTEPWVVGLRDGVRSSTAKGWSVRKEGKYVRLQVRGMGSTCLPFLWERGSAGDVQQRVRGIYALVCSGHTLKEASRRTEASSERLDANWRSAMGGFRRRLQELGDQISDKTWDNNYCPYLEEAVKILEGPHPPENAYDLCEAAMRRWAGKATSRHHGVNSLTRFLIFAMESRGLPTSNWTLTREQKREIKGKTAHKRRKAILSDQEMKKLIESVNNPQWRNALKLLTTYGLRREELRHLEPKRHHKHGVQMWCSYTKTCGRYKTKPRWLMPIQPNGAAWGDLALKLKNQEISIPPFKTDTALNTYLSRQAEWLRLKKQCEDRGEWLRPYAFRDSYSYRAHQQGFPLHTICAAMGHSLAVHQNHYVWAQEDTIFDIIDR